MCFFETLRGVRALTVHRRSRCFALVFPAKWLDLNSPMDQTKAEELGIRGFKFLSLRLAHRALQIEPFLGRFSSKTCYQKYHTHLKIVWRYSGTADCPGCTLAARTLS